MTSRLSANHQEEMKRRLAARRALKRATSSHDPIDDYSVDELIARLAGDYKPTPKLRRQWLEYAGEQAQQSGCTVMEQLYRMSYF